MNDIESLSTKIDRLEKEIESLHNLISNHIEDTNLALARQTNYPGLGGYAEKNFSWNIQ